MNKTSAVIFLVSMAAILLLSACDPNPIVPLTPAPGGSGAKLLYTAPQPVMALAAGQDGRVYGVTKEGEVLGIAPGGEAETIYSGLKRCGFSQWVIAALPGGDLLANDCAGSKDVLVRIDRQGRATALGQLEDPLLSLAADASGQVYLGLWKTEGDITVVADGYLQAADNMWGQVAIWTENAPLQVVYEGGLPLSLAVSADGGLYATLWGSKGRFSPQRGDYSFCSSREYFWVGLSGQVVIQQILPAAQSHVVSTLLSPASALAFGPDGTLYGFGLPPEGRCGIHILAGADQPQRVVLPEDQAGHDLTGLVAAGGSLYFSDTDGHFYRADLGHLALAEPSTASTSAVVTRPPEPTPPPAAPTTAPAPTAAATTAPRPTAPPTPVPTATVPPLSLRVTQEALLEDHDARHLAWSPDGQYLVVGTYYIAILDAQTLEEVYRIESMQWAQDLAFSPDGTMLVAVSTQGATIWQVDGWGEIVTLPDSKESWSVAWSPDGKTLALGISSVVKRYDVATAEVLDTIPIGGPWIQALAYSPDGQTLAVGGQGEVKLLDVATGEERLALPGDNWPNTVVFSPDGQFLAASFANGENVPLWEVASGRQVRLLGGHTTPVNSLAFSLDGRMLACGSGVQVKLWDVATGSELATLSGHSQDVNAVAWSPDGALLGTGASDVRLWKVELGAGAPEPTAVPPPAGPTLTPLPLSEGAISPQNAAQVVQTGMLEADMARQILWSPDGQYLVIGTHHIYIYDGRSYERIHVIDAIQSSYDLAFSPDGALLSSASYEGVILWSTDSWGQVRTLAGSKDTESLAFSPDGTMLATATGSTVKLWDVASGQEMRTLPGSSGRAVAFSPDGRILAAAGGVAGQDIRLWAMPGGVELPSLTGHTNWIEDLVFSPDGKLLASCAVDQSIRLWDIAAGRQVRALNGHGDDVTSVAFSPDGQVLASASWDLTVRLWEVATGEELRSLTGHTDWETAVAFSPDGAVLASGANEAVVRLWGVAP